jgi:hypothetical protein
MIIYEDDSKEVKAAKVKVVKKQRQLTKAKAELEIAKQELEIAKLKDG